MRESETGQRHAREANAKLLQRGAARGRLGQVFGKFIELAGHSSPSIILVRLLRFPLSAPIALATGFAAAGWEGTRYDHDLITIEMSMDRRL